MTPRPRPLLGMLLGLLLGLAVVGLLWQLGVIPPERTVLFGITALTVALVAGLLTREPARARGRYTAALVLASMLGGVALVGIPELVARGSISDGCTLEATVGDTTATPTGTTAFAPLDVPADGVVTWTAASDSPIAVTDRVAGVIIGGFEIPVRTLTGEAAPETQEISGEVAVADAITWIQDRAWLEPSGVYHAYGSVAGGAAACALDGYVSVAPAGVFATNTLVILWIAVGVLLLLIAWGALAVRRSFAGATRDDAAVTGAPATGFATGGPGEEADAAPADHIDPVPAWTPGRRSAASDDTEIIAAPAEDRVHRASAFAPRGAGADGGDGGDAAAPATEVMFREPPVVEDEPIVEDEPLPEDAPLDEDPAADDGEPEDDAKERIVPSENDAGPEAPSEDEGSGPRP
ncbi:hypothetical protein [Demequina phytophila]|uniref:hypothetical protein n=1 Tax=Demequina phytophila TaxID=1638981 RepID=UPI000AF46DD3|nr:hypothetical protein [Demequina phytophila]